MQVKPIIVGSNVSVMVSLLGSNRFLLDVQHHQAFDLRHDLFVAEARAHDRTGRAGRHTRAAALAQRRIDFGDHALFVEADGVERTQAVADAAAGAFLFDDAGPDRFERHFLLLDLAEHPGRGRRPLRDAGGNVLGPLGAAGDEDAVGHGRDRIELGMLLDEPAVGGAGNAEDLGRLLEVVPWLQTGGQNDHIHGMRRCLPSSVSST